MLESSRESPPPPFGVVGLLVRVLRKRSIPAHAGKAGSAALLSTLAVASLLFSSSFPAAAQARIDYDSDENGLIEVSSLAQLNAIRWDLDGDGASTDAAYAVAFPTPATGMGCPVTTTDPDDNDCVGYELMAHLDFGTDSAGSADSSDIPWKTNLGWDPIGNSTTAFEGVFEGNGHIISNLFIKRGTEGYVGLFGKIQGDNAVIRNLGLENVRVVGKNNTGGLLGQNLGRVRNSYVIGQVEGKDSIGGLVGDNGIDGNPNQGIIQTSYAKVGVKGRDDVGGLVGSHNGGLIRAVYAMGRAAGRNNVGGLIGSNNSTDNRVVLDAAYAAVVVKGTGSSVGSLIGSDVLGGRVINSYADSDRSGQSAVSNGGDTPGEHKTTAELQTPTGYTGIYADWNVDIDNADDDGDATTGGDDPWHFATRANSRYPRLKVDFNGDGAAGAAEFQNDPPAFDEGDTAARSVAENTPAGRKIGDPIHATDPDGDALTYELSGGPFQIDDDGQLTTTKPLNYEKKKERSYTVTVTVKDARRGSATLVLTVTVTDVRDETKPVFDDGPRATRSVDENTPANTDIGDPISAYDPRGRDITYSLPLAFARQFAIDTSTGQLRTTGALNYEINKSYSFTVAVAAGTGDRRSFAVIPVTINVNDLRELPGRPTGLRATVRPEGLDLQWADSKVGDPATGYDVETKRYATRIGEPWTSSQYTHSGTGTTAQIRGLTVGATYDVRVRAKNATGTGGWSTIEISTRIPHTPGDPPPNRAPVLDAGTSARRSIEAGALRGRHVGLKFTATDLDGDTLTYSLSGADSAGFFMDTLGRLVVGRTVPTRATKSSHSVIVTVSDGRGGTDSIAITINVTYVNEAVGLPSYVQHSPYLAHELRFEVVAPGDVGATGFEVAYQKLISQSPQIRGDWRDDRQDDHITVFPIDLSRFSERLYSMVHIVHLEIGYSYVIWARIKTSRGPGPWGNRIMATPNIAPTFDAGDDTTFTIAENTAANSDIGAALTATDNGDVLSYSLGGTDRAHFALSGNQLKTKEPLDYESKSSYSVTVTVNDGRRGTDSIAVTINLTDVNDAPVFADGVATTRDVAENTVTGSDVDSPVAATDPDVGDKDDDVIYTLGGTDGSSFTIVSSSGLLKTKAALDRETKDSYSVTVTATDKGGLSNTIAVTIKVTDVNEAPPVFPDASTTRSVAENSPPGTSIGNPVVATDPDGADTLTYTLGGLDGSSFGIGASSGQLKTKADLDFEGVDEYIVNVIASDGTWSDTVVVTIKVTNVNEAPSFFDVTTGLVINSATVTIAENTTAVDSDSVFFVFDEEGDDLTYALDTSASDDHADFTIGSATGKLSFKNAPNYEADDEYKVTLTVRDGKDASGTADTIVDTSIALTISVTDVNAATAFPDETTTRSVAENTAPGTAIGEPVDAADSDGVSLTYTLGGTDGSSFTIVSSSGQLKTKAALDYETEDSYAVTVTASDGTLSDSIAVTITVTNVDEAPEFAAGSSASVSVAEGSTAVGTYTATDPEGASVTYGLAATGDHAAFEVTSAGVLSFKVAPVHKSKDSYSVTVTATDVTSHTGSITIAITVSDMDEAPVFADGSSASVSVAEGIKAVGTYAATDPEGASVTYALDTTKGDHAAFEVTSAGVLSFKTAPDHETKGSYSVTVTATDATSHTGSITIAVTVSDVDEAPVFADGSSASVTVAENSTAVGTYTATDPEGVSVTYGLASTGDHASFEVTSAGVLSFKAAPDYESKDSYSVTVTASDATSHTGTIAVTITVGDVDEAPGPPTGLRVDAATGALAVSWVAPAAASGVPAVDGYEVQYRLRTSTGPTVWGAWVDHVHGDTSVEATISNLVAGSTYQVQVRATNPEGDSAWVGPTAGVPTANRAPAFTAGSSASVSVAEGSTAVGTYTATDPDSDAVTYGLAATGDHAAFEVTSAGVVSFKAAPDHETKDSYSVTVTASDGTLTGTIVLTVTVSDVNEPPEFAPDADVSPTVAEGSTRVGSYAATDPDDGDTVTYSLAASGDHAAFEVTSAGVLSFKVAPDYETEDSYTVTVVASDGTLSANLELTVGVSDVDEAPVFADGSSASVTVAENSTAVGTYTATDPEGVSVTYGLASTGDHASFEVTSAGVLSFKAAPDYESKDSYSVTVTASDATSHTGTIAVTITVGDVDEAPGPPTGLRVDAATGALAVSWVAPAAASGVPAVDGYEVQYRLRTSTGPTVWGAWVSHVHGDTSVEATISNLVAGSTYQVQVRATNPEGDSAWVGPTAGVPTANRAPAFTAGSSASVSVAEGSTAVGTYTATDPDSDAVTYGLAATGDHAAFEVTSAGVVSFKAAPDHETKDSYSVTVTASDGTLTGTIVLTVTVSDVNEPPEFAADADVSPTVAEGSTRVGSYAATDPDDGDTVTYSLAASGDHAAFEVTSAGVLSFKVAPDYETEDSYTVTVVASDGTLSANLELTVGVSDVDEAPVFADGSSASVTVAENSTAVGTYTATDPEGVSVTYGLASTGDHASFEVTSAGVLSFKAAPDYESKDSYSVTVTASDATSHTGTIAVTITVGDVDEAPGPPTGLRVDAATGALAVSWVAPAAAAGVPAVDGYEVQYRLRTSTGPTVWGAWVSHVHGDTSVEATISNLVAGSTYQVQVRATNPEGDSAWVGPTAGVPTANRAPAFTAGSSASVSVAEGSTAVGTYTATDPDSDAVTYGLAATGDHAAFEVTSAGVVSFKAAPDHETKDSYSVTVTASDGTLTGTIVLTVTVSDVNEPPEFAADADVSPTVAEGSTRVGSYAATDPDDGDTVTYSLAASGDHAAFEVTSAGVLSFKVAPDYETEDSYTVTVVASDGTLSANLELTVGVSDVDEAPVFADGSSASVTVAENSTAVGTYTATDPEGVSVTYGLASTGDHASFEVTSAGVLSFKAAPDYESKDSYSVTVTASDATSHTGTIAVTITVGDVDEAPGPPTGLKVDAATGALAVSWVAPAAAAGVPAVDGYEVQYRLRTSADGDSVVWGAWVDHVHGDTSVEATISNLVAGSTYQVQVRATNPEGDSAWVGPTAGVPTANRAPAFTAGSSASVSVAEGSTAVGTYTATDPDSDAVTYGLAATGDHAAFEVTSAGVVSFKAAPDHETKDSYSVTVTASDGTLTGTIVLTVTVSDVNEPPEFAADADVSPTVAEGSTRVGSYAATDPDDGDTVTYSLAASGDHAAFEVTSAGVLSFKVAPDYETEDSYTVTVVASDGTLSANLELTVGVSDVDEAPVFADGSSASVTVAENSTAVGTYTATDPEGVSVTYGLASTGDHASFEVTSAGVLSFKAAPDYESKDSYSVTVTASDATSHTGTIAVTITVGDVDEAPVFADDADTSPTVSEGSTRVGAYAATDPEGEPVTYGLASTGDHASFEVTSAGVLSFKTAPDYEAKSSYTVTVTASDGTLTGSLAITVTVGDVDQPRQVRGVPRVGDLKTVRAGPWTALMWGYVEWERYYAVYRDGRLLDGEVRSYVYFDENAPKSRDTYYRVVAYNRHGDALGFFDNGAEKAPAASDVAEATEAPVASAAPGVPTANRAPEFAAGSPASVTVAENTTAVGSFIATDPEGASVTYGLAAIGDHAAFKVTSAGVLSFKTAPDYETKDSYSVTVTASDGTLTVSLTITVTIGDVDEARQVEGVPRVGDLKVDRSPSFAAVAWGYVDRVEYYAIYRDGRLLDGEVYSYIYFDENAPKSSDTYYRVVAYNRHGDALGFFDKGAVKASDVPAAPAVSEPPEEPTANRAPVFAAGADASPTVFEGTTAVGSYVATDPEGDPVTYALAATGDHGSFTVTSAGVLSFKTAPDYEAKSSYGVTVTVSDGTLTASLTITVTVGDVDEARQVEGVPRVGDLKVDRSPSFAAVTWGYVDWVEYYAIYRDGRLLDGEVYSYIYFDENAPKSRDTYYRVVAYDRQGDALGFFDNGAYRKRPRRPV